MEMTIEELTSFQGGQLVVINQIEGYVYGGEIARVSVEERGIRVEFAWCAKRMMGGGWIPSDRRLFTANLEFYSFHPMNERFVNLGCAPNFESAVFSPPGHYQIDPAEVAGLEVSTTQAK